MAGSFSTAKAVSALIVKSVAKRGYAAAATQAQSTLRSGATNVMLNKKGSKEPAWWGPDPVTGYYRPENHIKETNAAELRQILASNANKATTN